MPPVQSKHMPPVQADDKKIPPVQSKDKPLPAKDKKKAPNKAKDMVKAMNRKMKQLSDNQKDEPELAKLQEFTELAKELQLKTHFDENECLGLLFLHDHMLIRDRLDLPRFREFLHKVLDINSDLMMDLMFQAFDRNYDGHVDQVEFVTSLSKMIRGTMDEMAEFCFSVYDMNRDGGLAREELHICYKGCFMPGFGIEPEDMDDAERDLVDIAMKKLDYDKDGVITLEDFKNAVRDDPLLVVACGECLPPTAAIERLLFLITEDHLTYTGPFLGTDRNGGRKRQQSNRPARLSRLLTSAASQSEGK